VAQGNGEVMRSGPDGPEPPWDAAAAVLAHSLLNSVNAVQMGAHALRRGWRDLDEEKRDELLKIIADQAAHIRGILQDMIRGLPSDVMRALNTLEESPQAGRETG